MDQSRRIRGGSKKPRSSAKRSYRKRAASSKCRKITRSAVCKHTCGCKQAKGKKSTFCRKSCNTNRRTAKAFNPQINHYMIVIKLFNNYLELNVTIN